MRFCKSGTIIIRLNGMRDPSLRSGWQAGRIFVQCNPETISHISILTSQFYHYARFFTTFRMTYQESFPPMSTQHSSLSFRMTGQGCFFGNPTNINPETISHISILTSQFYHYAGSFTAFRMTCRKDFRHSERVLPFYVILNELLGEEESLLRVRGDENYDLVKGR